jgi:hypothetical protein
MNAYDIRGLCRVEEDCDPRKEILPGTAGKPHHTITSELLGSNSHRTSIRLRPVLLKENILGIRCV